MKTIEERYYNDPALAMIVNAMVDYMEQLRLTPHEMREAAMLASIKFEMRYPRTFQTDSRQEAWEMINIKLKKENP